MPDPPQVAARKKKILTKLRSRAEENMPMTTITGDDAIKGLVKMTIDKRSEWVRKRLERRGEVEGEDENERRKVEYVYPARMAAKWVSTKPGRKDPNVRLREALEEAVEGIKDEVGCHGELVVDEESGEIKMTFW